LIVIESEKGMVKSLAVNVKFTRDPEKTNKFIAEYTVTLIIHHRLLKEE